MPLLVVLDKEVTQAILELAGGISISGPGENAADVGVDGSSGVGELQTMDATSHELQKALLAEIRLLNFQISLLTGCKVTADAFLNEEDS